MKKYLFSNRKLLAGCTAALLGLGAGAESAYAAIVNPGVIGPIDTQLNSFDVSGNGSLPLGRDPAGPSAPSQGYAYVDSNIHVTLANPPATGQAYLYSFLPSGVSDNGGNPPEIHNGDPLLVSSFFDVYFDVTIQDIDSSNNFWGPTGEMPDGATLTSPVQGPAHMELGGADGGQRVCYADTSKPNYGCLPPVGDAYIGHFKVVLPLGYDINGNGSDDTIKFILVSHQVGDVTESYISGSQVVDTFNSQSEMADGEIGDNIADPPFGPITLTGPTTAQQDILYCPPGVECPEPATLALFGTGLGLLGLRRWRKGG